MTDNSSFSNKSDNTQYATHSERQPLLSFSKSDNSTSGTTKKQQQKDKFPATNQPFTSSTFDHTNNDSLESNNDVNNNYKYGSVGESSSHAQSQHDQHDQQQLQQQQQQYSSHLRLYIVLALLLGIIFVASLVLLLLAPKFAQKTFENGVQLSFQQTSIQNVTQVHGNNIISMNVVGSVTLLSSAYDLSRKITSLFGDIQLHDTTLQVFQATPSTVTLSLLSAPLLQHSSMGNIHLPALTLSSGSNVTYFDFVTQFVVDDASALIKFCKDALTLKQVGWQVLGTLPIQVGWLPMENYMDLDKVVNIDGMDGLKQTEMKNMAFPGTHRLGGILLQGTVGIFNPSKTLSMTIGDVDFGIYLPGDNGDDVLIAVIRAEDTQLLGQQMNYFNVTGRTLPLDDKDTKKKQLMERFLARYLHGNASMVHVRGSNFGPDDDIYHDTTSLAAKTTTLETKVPDWIQKALASMTFKIPFPGTTHNDIIRSLTMDNIKIDFSMITGGAIVSGDAIALLQLPKEMDFDLDVMEIDPDVYIYLEHDSATPFGRLRPPHPCPSKTIHHGDPDDPNDGSIPAGMFMVKSSIQKAPFQVLPGHESEFEKFLDRVFKRHNSTVYLQGTADAMVVSDFGKLTVRDLTFKGKINTMGMQEMKKPPPKVTSMSIIKGYPDALQTRTKLIISNPSDVDVNLGTITLGMSYKGIEIGNVTIQELNLVHGSNNEFEADSFLYVKARQQRGMCYNDGIPLAPVVDFVGNYISGESTELVIAGRKGSTKSKLLASLMKQMVFVVQVPTFDEQPLLQNVQMNLLSSTAVAWLRNPFEGIDMQIININASATYQSQNIGSMYANFTDGGKGWNGPVDLPPICCSKNKVKCIGYVTETPRIPVMLKTIDLDMISKALGGKIEVAVDSIVTVMIDSFMLLDLQYKRNNITAFIKKTF